jgi:MFS family permease
VLQRVFKAFQYRDFRLMWIGACASSLGTWMQMVAQGWLIYNLSHSAFLLALDPVLATVPMFLFSLVGGVIADRVDRRYILIASQCIQLACALTLTGLAALGMVRVWHMLACSFISGVGQSFGAPAYQALIPTLVKKEDMPNAIALNSIQFNAAVMVGPALGAAAFHALGYAWCFGFNALSFLAPIVSLSLLHARFLPVKTGESILESMQQGFRFIWTQGAMAALILLGFTSTFLAVPMRTFLPVFAKDIFGRGAATYAMFLSISGLGSIVGALTVAGLGNLKRKGMVTLLMMIALGGATTVFALSRSLAVSSVALFVSGASMMAVFAAVNSLVQLIVTNEMRGRVMSVYNFSFRGGMTMGNLVGGWLVPIFTAPNVIAINGLALIAMAVYFLVAQRKVAAL